MAEKESAIGILLFVHGFGSSPNCWATMLSLVRCDEVLCSRYEIRTFEYPTKWIEPDPRRRLPDLVELGDALADEIDSPAYRGRALTLVGHSLGGLVILSCLDRLLQDENRTFLVRGVRQAVLFAPPCRGSTQLSRTRRFFSKFKLNPQETALRVLEADVSDLMDRITKRVVYSTSDSLIRCRVPITAFCGMQDNVVLRASAQGPFHSLKTIEGDHSTLIQPKGPEDRRFQEFREVLYDPIGHRHRFEVDLFETSLRIEPCERKTIQTASANSPRDIEYDNVAYVERAVTLAAGNRCNQSFTLAYGTRNGGYVVGETSHPNEAASNFKGMSEDTGTYYRFDFVPRPPVRYGLKVTVYKGFDPGQRNFHSHLGQHSYYRRLRFSLDLSVYLERGFVISTPPECFFSDRDYEHGELCNLRSFGQRVEPASESPDGVFRWELENKRTGIVDVTWDVEEPPSSRTGG